jgi:Sin3 binding region of histone deacetylase complex subunit SAP30
VDFGALPVEALLKYKRHYRLSEADVPPPPQKSKNYSRGKKRPREEEEEKRSDEEEESLYRIDLGAWRPRINKNELAGTARSHFNTMPHPRENETIVHFLYHVKTQGFP